MSVAGSPCISSLIENLRPLSAATPPKVQGNLVSDFDLEAIFNFNCNLNSNFFQIPKDRLTQIYMLNIAVEVEDGLQIKIGDQKSMYHRGGCMPKVVLDFRFGTIYMVN